MLTKMYLTNFLSFLDRTEIDFTASKYNVLSETNVYDNTILKGGLFIGPNAAGKSNVLKGIAFLINMIKGDGASFELYRCSFSSRPFVALEYEFDFLNKKVVYKIECNVKTKNISEEVLIDDAWVLKREGAKGELRIGESISKDDQLDKDTLFLRTASFNTGRFPQEPVLRKLIDYLNNSYYVDGYNRGVSWGKCITKYVDEYGVEKINKYLQEFNYDFFIEYGSTSTGEGATVSVGSNEKIVFFKRKSFPFPSDFYGESQGNQMFANMLPNLIRTMENPGMLIFDEFGNSLHNKLAEKIVKFFMKNAEKSQLFITSHDTNLISNSVFRPDQINLVTFNESKGSKVTRLSKFKPREAQNLEKMYLGGMFEGMPSYEKVKETPMMGRLYKINPTCPYCGEEHEYWTIRLTDEEQQVLDEHTRQHAGENPIIVLMSPPGLTVTRRVKCKLCHNEFEAHVAIRRESEVGWTHPDFLPLGKYPVY